MATISFKKEFTVTKKMEKDFVKLFDKKPQSVYFKDSKFEHVKNNKLLLEVLNKR